MTQAGPVNVFDNEDLYDVILLAGQTSPGKVTLSGHDRKIEWTIKAGPNLDGASMTLSKIPPTEFTASFYLVRDYAQGIDDFAAWPAFQKVIDSSIQSTTPKALDVYHPDLAANGIRSVVKASVGGMVYDGKGGATVVVKFQEYRAPKPKSGSPMGSKTGAPDPNADVKAQLSALTAEYQKTPWG